MPFEPEVQHHLAAAKGYVTLGLLADAQAELDRLPAEAQCLLEALGVRLALCQTTESWAAIQAAAKQLLALVQTAADASG